MTRLSKMHKKVLALKTNPKQTYVTNMDVTAPDKSTASHLSSFRIDGVSFTQEIYCQDGDYTTITDNSNNKVLMTVDSSANVFKGTLATRELLGHVRMNSNDTWKFTSKDNKLEFNSFTRDLIKFEVDIFRALHQEGYFENE